MAQRHISMRGEIIDMNRLRSVNAETVALGNANLNARGDIIGRDGTILKTEEQIVAEWEANKAAMEASIKPVDIKTDKLVPDVTPTKKVEKKIEVDDQDFNPDPPSTATKATTRRKITETDQ